MLKVYKQHFVADDNYTAFHHDLHDKFKHIASTSAGNRVCGSEYELNVSATKKLARGIPAPKNAPSGVLRALRNE